MKIKILTTALILTSTSAWAFENKWNYSQDTNTANLVIGGSHMATVMQFEGTAYLKLADLSGMVGCGFENNPPSEYVDVTVNGNKDKAITMCQSYQRIYAVASDGGQHWIISNLWQGKPVTIKTPDFTYNVGIKGFRDAVVYIQGIKG